MSSLFLTIVSFYLSRVLEEDVFRGDCCLLQKPSYSNLVTPRSSFGSENSEMSIIRWMASVV